MPSGETKDCQYCFFFFFYISFFSQFLWQNNRQKNILFNFICFFLLKESNYLFPKKRVFSLIPNFFRSKKVIFRALCSSKCKKLSLDERLPLGEKSQKIFVNKCCFMRKYNKCFLPTFLSTFFLFKFSEKKMVNNLSLKS